MSLTDEIIDQCVERYWRERDRYRKLASFAADKCELMIETSLIRAEVSSRAKNPERLRAKLRKQSRVEDEVVLDSVDAVFSWISDLAGVRITTYVERDRPIVVERLRSIFVGSDGGEIEIDPKDEPGKLYRATHCQVAIPPDELVGTYENLRGLTCEVQVCSLLAHVANEIEHDIRYKQLRGPISGNESDLLDALGQLTASGDAVVVAVIEAQERRQAATEGEFEDEHDFVVRMRGRFPEATQFAWHAFQLYEELVALGLDSPATIEAELLYGDYLGRSSGLLEELQARCEGEPRRVVSVDPVTSDALLVLLLEKKASEIERRHPAGRGRGRPSRIRSLATRFLQMDQAEGN